MVLTLGALTQGSMPGEHAWSLTLELFVRDCPAILPAQQQAHEQQ